MEEDLIIDPLFVGLTRPTTVFGIPYVAFVLEIMIVSVIFIGVGNPLYMLLCVPVHSILYMVSMKDPGVFSSMLLWAKTNSKSRNNAYWGGAVSFAPCDTVKEWDK